MSLRGGRSGQILGAHIRAPARINPEGAISDTYDFAVVGLGAIGSATAAALARRGHRVLGIDRYAPPHTMGSSHSETRMIREAYYQGSMYVPMVRAAYESWRELENESGRDLLRITGGLMIGRRDSYVFGGCLASARAHGLEHEELTPAQVRERFPAFHLEPHEEAVLEPHAGVLALDDCLEAILDQARAAGAELREERVTGWAAEPAGVRISTETGEHRARRVAFAVGAWTGRLFPGLGLPLEIERTVQYWFEPATPEAEPRLDPERCPAWVWEYGPQTTWYGFPRTERGVKVGMHLEAGRITDPDFVLRDVDDHEEHAMRGVLGRFMPDASGRLAKASVCMYTNTPDEAFILDRHPECADIAIFGGGSGHGFKFARVLGNALADVLTDREPAHDLGPFRITRF